MKVVVLSWSRTVILLDVALFLMVEILAYLFRGWFFSLEVLAMIGGNIIVATLLKQRGYGTEWRLPAMFLVSLIVGMAFHFFVKY